MFYQLLQIYLSKAVPGHHAQEITLLEGVPVTVVLTLFQLGSVFFIESSLYASLTGCQMVVHIGEMHGWSKIILTTLMAPLWTKVAGLDEQMTLNN